MTGRFLVGVGVGVPFLYDDESDPNAGFYWLWEDGNRIELEDDSGELILETAP